MLVGGQIGIEKDLKISVVKLQCCADGWAKKNIEKDSNIGVLKP